MLWRGRFPFIFSILFLFSFSATVCFAENNVGTLRERLSGFTVGGHQGGLFRHQPNTIKNFIYNKNVGAEIVEMDLRLSKDGIPMVFHDEKMGVWTNCFHSVDSYTAAYIQKHCHFYTTKEKVPTFEEVLQWSQGSIVIDAEFKETQVIAPALELIKKYQAHNWVYFQTQDDREKYRIARSLDSEVGLLYAIHDSKDLDWALELNDSALLIIEVDKNTRTTEMINRIHNAHKLVTEDVWHLSSFFELWGATCTQAGRLGIDILISNRPKQCVQQRNFYLH